MYQENSLYAARLSGCKSFILEQEKNFIAHINYSKNKTFIYETIITKKRTSNWQLKRKISKLLSSNKVQKLKLSA